MTFIRAFNGLSLKMGTKIDDAEYVILVDVDNKHNTIKTWKALLKQHHKATVLRTPTATTGNGGLHYLFKVSEEQLNKMQNSYTGLTKKTVKDWT